MVFTQTATDLLVKKQQMENGLVAKVASLSCSPVHNTLELGLEENPLGVETVYVQAHSPYLPPIKAGELIRVPDFARYRPHDKSVYAVNRIEVVKRTLTGVEVLENYSF